MTKIADASNFLDINGLSSITAQSNSTEKGDKQQALKKAAQQFEAIFTQMLLKSMRSAQDVLASDNPMNSESSKFYRDMQDQQMTLDFSKNGSLGLAKIIERQLGGDSDNFTPASMLRNDGGLDRRAAVSASRNRQVNQPNVLVTTEQVNQAAQIAPKFEQPQDFVSLLSEPAKAVQKRLGIPFEVVIAQAALETGWGQKIIKTEQGKSSNNLFNIKADNRWQGDKTQKNTLEFEQGAMVKKSAPFRVYDSIKESVNDYVDFLSSGERYQDALNNSGDVEHFLHGLQKAGYATDPNYATKILGTLRKVTSLLNN